MFNRPLAPRNSIRKGNQYTKKDNNWTWDFHFILFIDIIFLTYAILKVSLIFFFFSKQGNMTQCEFIHTQSATLIWGITIIFLEHSFSPLVFILVHCLFALLKLLRHIYIWFSVNLLKIEHKFLILLLLM